MSKKSSRSTFRDRLEEMVQTLRNEMIQGKYKAGDYLPSEEMLVNQFQLSNKSIRNGLDQLVEEGLIIKVHRIGSRVTEVALKTYQHITFGYFPSVPRDLALPLILDAFHKQHPTIRVSTFALPANPTMTMVKDYLKHGMLDVFTVNNTLFQMIDEHDGVSMLDEVQAQEGIYPFLNEAFTRQGRLLAHPIAFSPLVLLYNKEHFLDAGVPEPDSSWKWADAIRNATTLTTGSGRHGFCFHPLSDNRWPAFLLQSGVEIQDKPNGGFTFDRKKLIQGIRQCREIIRNQQAFSQYMSENNDDTTRLFAEGKVSMIIATYFAMNDLKDITIAYDISPLPFIDQPVTLSIVFGVAVNKSSKAKEAAHTFAAFFSSFEGQQLIAEQTLSIAAAKTAAEAVQPSNGVNRPARFAMFREILPTLRTHDMLKLPDWAWEPVRQLIKMYWSGMIDEDELCNLLENELSKLG